MFKEEFILNKDYYRECFDESIKLSTYSKPKYFLITLLVLLGLVSSYGLNNHYLGNFLIVLAVIECVAYYYRRPWWVARQMVSRASGSKVTLEIDEQGIRAINPYKEFKFTWQDITEVKETNLGLILTSHKGMQYISNEALSEEARAYILEKNSH